MKKITAALGLAALIASATFASIAIAQTVPVQGQVTKIDEATGRMTLKHEEIKNLDMEPMTMVFRVKDPAMLKAVKVGEAVIFEADRVNGAITIVKIEPKR